MVQVLWGLCLLNQVEAGTLYGSLTQDRVLGPESGPITIASDLVIAQGAVLTIKPGTVLRIQPTSGGKKTTNLTENTDISVLGTLRAVGTPEKPIVLEPIGNYRWGALFLARGSGSSMLKHCNIRGGRIIINGSSPTVVHCNVFEGGGIEIAHMANPTIRGNNLYYNSVGLRLWTKSSAGVIRDNNIVQNGYGIYVDNFLADLLIIEENNIHANNKFDVTNRSTQDLLAPKNYWGSTNTDVISRKIFDGLDQRGLGAVTFRPIRSSEQAMTWALEVNPNLPPSPRIQELIYQETAEKMRPPIGFFQVENRRFGFHVLPGVVFPKFDNPRFSYGSEFHLGGEFRLVYDETKSMGLEFFQARFTSLETPQVLPEEFSELSWFGVGLRGEWRPLEGKMWSPVVSAAGALHRLRFSSTYYLDQQAKEGLTDAITTGWDMGLSIGAGISVVFQEIMESQLTARYHIVQTNNSASLAQSSPRFIIIGISLLRYI